MDLQTVFRFSIFSLVALSGVMLAYAEEGLNPEWFTLPLALAALIFVEIRGVVSIGPFWSNAFGLLAFLLCSGEFFGGGIEGRLLSGAHLLVYLTWIVLFQRKSAKQYWWMCALSVLQVAVGSVLTQTGTYGLMLFIYMFLAVWTLAVFLLHQAQRRYEGTEKLGVEQALEADSRAPAAYALLNPTASTVVSNTRAAGRYSGRSQSRWSIQLDPTERWISWRFASGMFLTVCAGMAVAALFFVLIPRVWIGRGLPSATLPPEPGRTLTGFTDEVRLGDIGEILESNEPVLEVRLYDHDTGEPLRVEEYQRRMGYEEPLFRGAVLGTYADGRWTKLRWFAAGTKTISELRETGGVIRQEIRMHPIGVDTLLTLAPVQKCYIAESNAKVFRHLITGIVSSDFAENTTESFDFVAMTPKNATAQFGLVMELPSQMHREALKHYSKFPAEDLPRLINLAQRIVRPRSPDAAPLSVQEKARRLEAYLRDSGEFHYSLNQSVKDPTIDPVEDFLFNRKEGHCEYYASALALMLRAVGIPSRLVSGFKGGESNRYGNLFTIEQRHAHAWVEVQIDGRWIVFDATPSQERSASVAEAGRSFRSIRDIRSMVGDFWSRNILNLSLPHQRSRYYVPVKNFVNEVMESVKQGRLSGGRFLGPFRSLMRHPELWFSWRGGVATFLLLALFSGLFVTVRAAGRTFRRLFTRLDRRRQQQTLVEFYERFQRICEARGLIRAASQTQAEFASRVGDALKQPLMEAELIGFPVQLVGAFYRVRFGEDQLSDAQLHDLEFRLSRLELCLAGEKNGRK